MKNNKPSMGEMFGGETGGGFLGMPLVDSITDHDPDIVLMGAGIATPYPSVGAYCADAPSAIRGAFGWPGVLQHHDFDLDGEIFSPSICALDWGDLQLDANDFLANRIKITEHVVQVLQAGAVPMILGGDDSIPIPVFQAYEQEEPITILQLDAHIDWRDEVAGERMGLSSNMRRASEMPWVKDIVQVGARGLGSARPSEVQDAREWGVKFVPMSMYQERGVDYVMEQIPANSRVFVTLDIDAMDPSVVPAVIGPAPGGLHYWQGVNLFKTLAKRNPIVGFNLVELMPANDIGGRGALLAARLVAVMMGLISRQK